jgi:CheY-like chemotaxis protein
MIRAAVFVREREIVSWQPAHDQEIQMNDRAILVVDDIPAILTLIKRYLEGAGFNVITAEDGLQGWAAYTRQSSVIKLLLTDVEMPNMTGTEMADRVLRDNPDLPVLFMSGNAPSTDRGWGCVSKPFRRAELLARVRIALTPRRALKSPRTPPEERSELPR